jgi:hypothetical protein
MMAVRTTASWENNTQNMVVITRSHTVHCVRKQSRRILQACVAGPARNAIRTASVRATNVEFATRVTK